MIDLSCSKRNLLGSCLDKIVSSSNGDIGNNSICIHGTRQDVIVDHVNIPPPVPTNTVAENNSLTFTDAMRRALADSIKLQHLPIRLTDFTGATITSTGYYNRMRTHLKSRFNMRLVPVIGDGNCLFRTLSHILFGNESEHQKVRLSLINTFEQNPYVAAFCSIQGYNVITLQHHLNAMKRTVVTWGTVNELIMLGILARINVSYVNAADQDPSKWVITRDANPIQSMAIIDYRLSYFLSIGLSIGLSNILSIGLSIGLSNILSIGLSIGLSNILSIELSIGLLSMSFHRFFSIISDLLVD